ncbi:MAG: hypothetical protein HQK79_11615 [Desulfobacterales bacterium]|nr:hypothetical protein [Desulfobacterales bacterium]
MKITKFPVTMTIFFALMSGLFIMLLSNYIYHPLIFKIFIALNLIAYSFLLSSWGEVPLSKNLIPVIIVLYLTISGIKLHLFLMTNLFILSYFRSFICFKQPLLKGIIIEIILCFGGGSLIFLFNPISSVSWAISMWMFFLIQSIYFIFNNYNETHDNNMDPFEVSRKQVEEILSGI